MSIYGGVYFSPSENSFFLSFLKASYTKANTWPSDAVYVSDDVFKEYGLTNPLPGYALGESGGMPTWVKVN